MLWYNRSMAQRCLLIWIGFSGEWCGPWASCLYYERCSQAVDDKTVFFLTGWDECPSQNSDRSAQRQRETRDHGPRPGEWEGTEKESSASLGEVLSVEKESSASLGEVLSVEKESSASLGEVFSVEEQSSASLGEVHIVKKKSPQLV